MSSYSKQELETYKNLINSNPRIKYWTTFDGDKIPIDKLKDDHLYNILKHLEHHIKNAKSEDTKKVRQWSYDRMYKEFKKRMLKTPAGRLLYGEKKL